MKKKITVKVDNVDTVLYIAKPGKKQETEARIISNKAFKKALDSGCVFKKKLNEQLVEQGLLTKEEKDQIEKCSQIIEDGRKKLKAGGIELSEAKKLALEMKGARYEMLNITLKINDHESYTIEGQADEAYFDALVAHCTFTESGGLFFKSYEDYLDKAYEDYAVACAKELAALIYGDNRNWERDLPENQFLKKYNFVDDNLRLINKDGKFVDSEGRLINEEGRYIDTNGDFVDINGNRVDANGDPLIEAAPFLDNGNPV